ncbi:carbohydrate sulfotransferase 11-like isoform X2 [Eriocheir sinensis]|uniref:carbohydrate sulfotransferase 11-like isoform X2 n=1 Tax=Eriocheir sinensis TaxID=95602 RepID=UPI0021C896A8|nr:carbohydrate sulfotransferase 11-like isoform X2 [Eriocheir sinensis]
MKCSYSNSNYAKQQSTAPPVLQNEWLSDPYTETTIPTTTATTTTTSRATSTTTPTTTTTTTSTTSSRATTTTTTSITTKTAVSSLDNADLQRIERRMQERVLRLRRRCEGRVQAAPNETVTWNLNMFVRSRIQVLEDHRLAVCVVYKAGSTTWSSIVAHRYNNTKILQGRSFYKMLGLMLPTIPRFYEIFNSTDFARVVMARHPLTRLLSGYKEKLGIMNPVSAQAKKYIPLILQHAHNKNYTDEELYAAEGALRVVPTFREFVSYLMSRPPEEYDPHWRPVSLLCGLCHVQYTAVVLTETYNEDMLYVMRTSGMDKLVDVNLLKVNNNKGPGEETRRVLNAHYSALGTPLLRRIIDVYKDDMEMFGYTLDSLKIGTSELSDPRVPADAG